MTTPVAILTMSGREWASSRFRGFWLQDAAPDLFTVYSPDDTHVGVEKHPVIVFQKRNTAQDVEAATRFQAVGKKIVYDMTDPLWWWDPVNVTQMIQIADVVICSSGALASEVKAIPGRRLHGRVLTIPDRMPPSAHPTVVTHGERKRPIAVWFGIAPNRLALGSAMSLLNYVGHLGHTYSLWIIDDRPDMKLDTQTENFAITHIPWALETIHANLLHCDFAILPPHPGPWGRYKSNNKEVTAWWAGLPVTDGYDPQETIRLIHDVGERRRQGEANRKLAEEEYDIALSVADWRALLTELGVP